MKSYIKSTDELPPELTPVWVSIWGKRSRKMYRVGDAFYYCNRELDKSGCYCSISDHVSWKYIENKHK